MAELGELSSFPDYDSSGRSSLLVRLCLEGSSNLDSHFSTADLAFDILDFTLHVFITGSINAPKLAAEVQKSRWRRVGKKLSEKFVKMDAMN